MADDGATERAEEHLRRYRSAAYTDAHPDGDPFPVANRDSYGHDIAHANAYRLTFANPESDRYAFADPHADAYALPFAVAHPHA